MANRLSEINEIGETHSNMDEDDENFDEALAGEMEMDNRKSCESDSSSSSGAAFARQRSYAVDTESPLFNDQGQRLNVGGDFEEDDDDQQDMVDAIASQYNSLKNNQFSQVRTAAMTISRGTELLSYQDKSNLGSLTLQIPSDKTARNSMSHLSKSAVNKLSKNFQFNEKQNKTEKQQILDLLHNSSKFAEAKTEDELDRMTHLQSNRKQLGALQNIALMNQEVERLKKANEVFNINVEGKTYEHEFRHDDPIFTQASKNRSVTSNAVPYCNCCKKNYKKTNETRYCDFCSQSYCATCRPFQKPYPKGKNGEEGWICKICTRKFHLRELLQEGALQIEAQTNQLLGKQGMMNQVDKAETKIKDIVFEGKKQIQLYGMDIQKITLLNEKLEFKQVQIIKQQETLKQQSGEYVEQQGIKMDLTQELKVELENTKTQQQILSDEVNTINNHIILTQQEYYNLDQEWKQEQRKAQLLAEEKARIAMQLQRKSQPVQQPNQSGKRQKKDKKKKKGKVENQDFFEENIVISPKNKNFEREQTFQQPKPEMAFEKKVVHGRLGNYQPSRFQSLPAKPSYLDNVDDYLQSSNVKSIPEENENEMNEDYEKMNKYKHPEESAGATGPAHIVAKPYSASVAVEGYTDDYDTAPPIFDSIDLGHKTQPKKSIRKGQGGDADASCCQKGGCTIF